MIADTAPDSKQTLMSSARRATRLISLNANNLSIDGAEFTVHYYYDVAAGVVDLQYFNNIEHTAKIVM